MTAALQTVRRLKSLTFNGRGITSDVVEALTGASYSRSIDGASTLTMSMHDSARTLLRSGLVGGPTITKVDRFAYQLVKVRKAGDGLTLTFEDLAVTTLRGNTRPRKAAAGTVTHVEFVRQLVGEERWLKLTVPSGVKAPKTRVELARGDAAAAGDGPEGTWEAIGRIADERGWRRYVRNPNEIMYVPETWLFQQDPAFRIVEYRDGVDDIDFDYDVGKPVGTMTVQVRAGRWSIPPGTVVEVRGQGPANGKWLVESVDASLFELPTRVKLVKPRPVLPEPEPSTAGADRGENGYGDQEATTGAGGRSSAAVERFVAAALDQRGKPYVWGGKGPSGFDCSGLATWAARKAGVSFPGGSKNQYAACRSAGRLIPVARATSTRGAVLLRMTGDPTHIAISLGDGKTIEARGRAWGVGVFSASGRGWTHGGLVPGMAY